MNHFLTALLALPVALAQVQAQPPPSQPPAAGPPSADAPDAVAELPRASRLERLLFNPRERTARGLAAVEEERYAEAAADFRSAGRLATDNPLSQFNAGTAELLSPNEPNKPPGAEKALPPLAYAAEHAAPDLAPAAHYNLGNARLAAGDPAGAVESFKDSLRVEPGNPDVKFNLELALRELEKQQQQQQDQQQSQEPSEKDESQDEPQDEPQKENEGDQQEQDEGQDQQLPPPDPGEEETEDPQPQEFAEQPDMTAEQAEAILEAVENLEREQRRQQAAERARESGKKGKDW